MNLIDHVRASIAAAERRESKLPDTVLKIDGMSSPKVRHFLNNLCSFSTCRYLEIGTWKGSTLISALYGNSVECATAIDNFSEFGGPRDEFRDNCSKYIPSGGYRFFDADCFEIDKHLLQHPFNTYFYDGPHSFGGQMKAFTYFDDLMSDPFIAVVDDWNLKRVKQGTRAAFEQLGYSPIFEAELPAKRNGDMRRWWNGLYVAVVSK